MKEVRWTGEDHSGHTASTVEYRAEKFTRKEIWGNLRGHIQSLVGKRRQPTKIISDKNMISRYKFNFHSRLRGDALFFDYGCIGLFPVVLQIDRRIKDGTVYILYEELTESEDEAPEFAGLDELP